MAAAVRLSCLPVPPDQSSASHSSKCHPKKSHGRSRPWRWARALAVDLVSVLPWIRRIVNSATHRRQVMSRILRAARSRPPSTNKQLRWSWKVRGRRNGFKNCLLTQPKIQNASHGCKLLSPFCSVRSQRVGQVHYDSQAAITRYLPDHYDLPSLMAAPRFHQAENGSHVRRP